MELYYIYKITNLINQKVYIGQSKNIKRRWRDHKASAKSENPTQIIHKVIKRVGLNNFSFEIIASCLDLEAANDAEEICIKQFKSYIRLGGGGYNLTLGGNNRIIEFTEETKRKLSENWHLYHSQENLDKMHMSNIGRKYVGRKQSNEGKQKRAASFAAKRSAKTCAVDGCEETIGYKVDGIRYCKNHARRLRTTGTTGLRPRIAHNKGKSSLEETRKKLSLANKGNDPVNKIKFSDDQIIAILSDNRGSRKIAKDFKVSKPVILRIRKQFNLKMFSKL